MGKHQNTWSHRTKIIIREIKIIFHALGSLAGFPVRVIVLWQENIRGTQNAPLACDRYNGHKKCIGQIAFFWILILNLLLWMLLLNVWDNVPMDLKYVCQQYFTCMCFLGFIRYNKYMYLDVNWLIPKISVCRARIEVCWRVSEANESHTSYSVEQADIFSVSIIFTFRWRLSSLNT